MSFSNISAGTAAAIGLVTASLSLAQIQQGPLRVLVPELGAFRSIESYAVSPDDQFVVYIADKDSDNDFELFAVPVEGGVSVKLNASLAVGADIDSFKISPTGDRVAYLADQNEANVTELFSVAITGGTATRINTELVENGDVIDYFFTPDASRIIYLADQDEDEKTELYSSLAVGGDTEKLNISLIGEGDVADAVISPNSQDVAYAVDDEIDEQYNIYSVSSDGGSSTKLNDTLMVLPDNTDDHKVSFDSTKVIFLAKQGITEPLQLFSNDISGGTPIRLNGTLVEGGGVSDFKVSPSDESVVYLADQIDLGVSELFLTKSSAQQVSRINGSLPTGGSVHEYQLSPEGTYVIYQATELSTSSAGLYSKDLTSSTPRIHLSGNDISNQFHVGMYGGLSPSNNFFYATSGNFGSSGGIWLLSLDGKQEAKKIFKASGLGSSLVAQFVQTGKNPTLTETNAAGTHAIFIHRELNKFGIKISAVAINGNLSEITRVYPKVSATSINSPLSYSLLGSKNTAVIHASRPSPLGKQLYSVDNVGVYNPLCLPVKTMNSKLASYCL